MLGDLLIFIFCLLASAVFSASETALTSLAITRREALRHHGSRLSRAAFNRWSDAPGEFLITILVGNNLVNVVASALASRIALSLSAGGGLALAIGVTTLAILIFGEITPKTLAQQHAEYISRKTAPFLYVLDFLLKPLNRILGLMSSLLSSRREKSAPVTQRDLLLMLQLAHRHAQIPRESRHMIESVLRLEETIAREVMLPRPQIVFLDINSDAASVFRIIRKAGHSRFPLIDGSPDEIRGVLHVKKLLDLQNGRDWAEFAEEALFIPETRPLPLLLRDFRTRGKHMAIVLDEFGGCSGMVTLEDIMELLVGEIRDEFESLRSEDIIPLENGYSVAAHLSLRRLERLFHRGLDDVEDIDSIGGVLLEQLGEDIRVGDEIEWSDLLIQVLEVSDGRAVRLFLKAVEKPGLQK